MSTKNWLIINQFYGTRLYLNWTANPLNPIPHDSWLRDVCTSDILRKTNCLPKVNEIRSSLCGSTTIEVSSFVFCTKFCKKLLLKYYFVLKFGVDLKNRAIKRHICTDLKDMLWKSLRNLAEGNNWNTSDGYIWI